MRRRLLRCMSPVRAHSAVVGIGRLRTKLSDKRTARFGRATSGAPPDCQRFCRLALVAAENIIRPVIAVPRIAHGEFHCFWSTATGWGTFTYQPAPAAARFELKVLEGVLACKSCEITINGNNVSAKANGRIVGSSSAKGQRGTVVHLNEAVKLNKGEALVIVPVA